MTRRIYLLLLLLALTCFSASHIEAAQKLKVLVITGGHGFQHDPFFKMFADNPDITYTETQQGKVSSEAYDRADLTSYDVVVLYDMVQNITEEQKAKFKSLFQKGVGLVVLHHALVSYQQWPEFERIVGGHYPEAADQKGKVTEAVGYQHDVDIPVVVMAKNHPVTKGISDFLLRDEIYWGFRVGKDVTPLLTTTQPKSGKPLAWTRNEGKSRIVTIQSGHGPSAYENENYRKLLAQSIRWVAHK